MYIIVFNIYESKHQNYIPSSKFLPSQHAQLQRLIIDTNAALKRVANTATPGFIKPFCC